MSKLFFEDSDVSDNETEFKINNEYAKNYNNWRQKEELNKLKTKYGESALELSIDDSSSSEEDSDGDLITEKFEKDFFKTLACLKKKDPKIYDGNVEFFEDLTEDVPQKLKKSRNSPMFIKDYERKLLLEKGGNIDVENDEAKNSRARSPTYMEEQKKLIDDLKKGLENIDDKEDDTFKVREKTSEEMTKEDEDYKQWLLGQKVEIDDEKTQEDLKPLKDFWTDPKLDKNEKFLRDYILKKRFLETEDKNYIPSYEEIVHDSDDGISEDEKEVERQDDFEHKYNYRFEEPDAEFIKRYPRTMENSVRKKDDKRKQKRAEVKERKQKEKQQKMDEIRELKELKRKEIEEKIQKLREITGNDDMEFMDDDIDGEFDPEAHDKRMRNLFNNDFYQGEEGDKKPKFPELDEELEIENWDEYENVQNENNIEQDDYTTPHCEDDDFNMDCDFDSSTLQNIPNETKSKKKRKRKSNFAKVIQEVKPVFDPNDKTYEEYLDEYYKLDCEDIIGDIPCRFKYRKVVPNSFGLSIEEILMAKDRELNRWCSLKKAVQIRPDHVEKYDVIAYQKKSSNEQLKKKILSSLYQEKEENNTMQNISTPTTTKKNRKHYKEKGKGAEVSSTDYAEIIKELKKIDDEQANLGENETLDKMDTSQEVTRKTNQKKKKIKIKNNIPVDENGIQNNQQTQKHLAKGRKQKGKKKPTEETKNNVDISNTTAKKKMKRKYSETDVSKNIKNNMGKKKIKKGKSSSIDISDSRLLAFGIKPKKFKNKMKYGKTK